MGEERKQIESVCVCVCVCVCCVHRGGCMSATLQGLGRVCGMGIAVLGDTLPGETIQQVQWGYSTTQRWALGNMIGYCWYAIRI